MLTAICVLLGVIIIELLFVGIFVYDMAFRTGQQLHALERIHLRLAELKDKR